MRASTKVTSKGQVVIPKPIRDRLKWSAGTRLEVEVDGSTVRMRTIKGQRRSRAETDPLDEIFGLLRGTDVLERLEADHRAEVEADELARRRR
jgi:AbrB family looped-hinge helix DNA binding protein